MNEESVDGVLLCKKKDNDFYINAYVSTGKVYLRGAELLAAFLKEIAHQEIESLKDLLSPGMAKHINEAYGSEKDNHSKFFRELYGKIDAPEHRVFFVGNSESVIRLIDALLPKEKGLRKDGSIISAILTSPFPERL